MYSLKTNIQLTLIMLENNKQLSFKTGLNLGTKITSVGGGWYGDIDTEKSQLQQDVIYIDETVNTKKFRPYFRSDVKSAYKINTKKITHEIPLTWSTFLTPKTY